MATETIVNVTGMIDIRYAPVSFGVTAIALCNRRYVGVAFRAGCTAAGCMTAVAVITKAGVIRFTREQPVIGAMTTVATCRGLYVGR